ncbi:MAG: presqualene diphosphate synthase HpnD [Paracoccaceae bacterium]
MSAGIGIDALGPLPAGPGDDPAAIVARITARARSSFSTGMRILSKPRREAMWALYAFSRLIDDIADEDWPVAEKRRLLTDWRAEVDRIEAGAPVSAVGQALAEARAAYDLPVGEFHALIDGMQMDAEGPIVAPPMATLRLYTRRVAGAVGLVSMRIFGAWRGEISDDYARALGDAFQLTNILRDVEEDAALGRLYLPAEALDRAGVPHDPDAAVRHPGLSAACAEVGALARAEFETARALIPAHSRRALAPALLMTGVYATYLARMEAAGFRRETVVRLSSAGKLWRGLLCFAAPGAVGRAVARAGTAHG